MTGMSTWLTNGALHSLVVRLLWEQNVGGSNPLAPTKLIKGDKNLFIDY